MTTRRPARRTGRPLAATGLLLALALGASACGGGADDTAAPASGDASSGVAASPGASPSGGGAAGGTDAAEPAPLSSASPSGAAGGGATASPSPTRVTNEVLVEPPDASSTVPGATGPGSLAQEQPVARIDLGALPARATTAKGVLPGWPRQALPIVALSRVRSTSVSPSSGVVQLGLDAVTSQEPAAVLRRYRQAMVAHGFAEQTAADPNQGTTIAFAQGSNTVSLTVTTVPNGTAYAVLAVLRPTP